MARLQAANAQIPVATHVQTEALEDAKELGATDLVGERAISTNGRAREGTQVCWGVGCSISAARGARAASVVRGEGAGEQPVLLIVPALRLPVRHVEQNLLQRVDLPRAHVRDGRRPTVRAQDPGVYAAFSVAPHASRRGWFNYPTRPRVLEPRPRPGEQAGEGGVVRACGWAAEMWEEDARAPAVGRR